MLLVVSEADIRIAGLFVENCPAVLLKQVKIWKKV